MKNELLFLVEEYLGGRKMMRNLFRVIFIVVVE